MFGVLVGERRRPRHRREERLYGMSGACQGERTTIAARPAPADLGVEFARLHSLRVEDVTEDVDAVIRMHQAGGPTTL